MGKNTLKWIAGAALLVAGIPAIGQARSHYTGTTPARVTPVSMSASAPAATKLTSSHKKKHPSHKKHTKLHSHKKPHKSLSTKKKV